MNKYRFSECMAPGCRLCANAPSGHEDRQAKIIQFERSGMCRGEMCEEHALQASHSKHCVCELHAAPHKLPRTDIAPRMFRSGWLPDEPLDPGYMPRPRKAKRAKVARKATLAGIASSPKVKAAMALVEAYRAGFQAGQAVSAPHYVTTEYQAGRPPVVLSQAVRCF